MVDIGEEEEGGRVRDLKKGSSNLDALLSPSSKTAPALVVSNSGKRFDQTAGKKKYVKQVTGWHKDTDLHLAAKRGDLAAVRQVMDEITEQMDFLSGSAYFDADLAEVRAAMVNEVNELGETALAVAAEEGHVEIVKELPKYSNKESVSRNIKVLY